MNEPPKNGVQMFVFLTEVDFNQQPYFCRLPAYNKIAQ